jgi:FixJ family two-component response regulator
MSSQGKPMIKKRTVMFVDDDSAFLDSIARLFHNWDLDLRYEANGAAALLAMEHQVVDVIVVDNRMPGMSGSALLHETAQYFPEVVSILLSGHIDVELLMLAINSGNVFRVLEKPCSATTLRATIIAALKRKIELERIYQTRSMDEYSPLDMDTPGMDSPGDIPHHITR